MVEHCDKHSRNTVEAGDLFLIDARKRGLRREVRHRAHGRAVSHRCGHRKRHTEAMEHRNLDHHSVCRGESHAVSDTFSVVNNVVVSKHNALGEACCTRRVLHIANVTWLNRRRHSCDLLAARERISIHSLVKGKASILLESAGYNVSEEGKLLCVERLAGDCIFDFGAERVNYFLVI